MNRLGNASRIALLGSAATFCLGMPTGALAQDAAAATATTAQQAPEPQGNEIIVPSQKREQALLDVPQSISVVTAETLQNLHATRFSDYLTRLPSANIVEPDPLIRATATPSTAASRS